MTILKGWLLGRKQAGIRGRDRGTRKQAIVIDLSNWHISVDGDIWPNSEWIWRQSIQEFLRGLKGGRNQRWCQLCGLSKWKCRIADLSVFLQSGCCAGIDTDGLGVDLSKFEVFRLKPVVWFSGRYLQNKDYPGTSRTSCLRRAMITWQGIRDREKAYGQWMEGGWIEELMVMRFQRA